MRRLVALAAACLLPLSLAAPATADTPGPQTGPKQPTFATALVLSQLNPDLAPPRTNDFGCQPSNHHPRPVVLVHGTFENAYDNWAGFSGRLARDGYCAFALNYGGQRGTAFRALTGIAKSAHELRHFVNRVLDRPGAHKVDLVGHSQGDMMPRYYLRFLGGAEHVCSLVGLSSSNHGTDANGVFDLLPLISGLGGNGVFDRACKAWRQQASGSRFLRRLNHGSDTVKGVHYTTISTKKDEVVTPYTNAFLKDQRGLAASVRNITLQKVCPDDRAEHLNIPYDPVAQRLVRNALDPSTARKPDCGGAFGPGLRDRVQPRR